MKITKRLAKRGGSYSSKQLDSVTKLLYKRACQRAFSRFPLHSSPTILCIQCLSRTGRNLWTTLFPCTSIPHNLTTDLTRHSFNEQRNMPNIASPLMTNKGKIRRGGTLIRATFIAWNILLQFTIFISWYQVSPFASKLLQIFLLLSLSIPLPRFYLFSKSILPAWSTLFSRKKKNLVTSSLKGLGKRELGNKDRITFFLSKSSLGVKRCASKAQREDSRRACVHAHTRPEKWFGGSLVRKKRKKNRKKEKEAKTKKGKKVEHNGKRKEWTSLKKPGAQGGGSGEEEEEEARHQEETEKNRATKSETPAAVNIAFAGCVLLVVHECCIPVKRVLFVRTICTRVSRMPVHFLWRDGSKLRRRSRNFDTRLYCGIVVCRFS